MATKTNHVVDFLTGSMGGDLTSHTVDCSDYSLISVQAIWSANSNPTGKIIIGYSNDGSNFIQPTSMQYSVGDISEVTNIMMTDTSLAAKFLKIMYDRSSGGSSDTLNIHVMMRE